METDYNDDFEGSVIQHENTKTDLALRSKSHSHKNKSSMASTENAFQENFYQQLLKSIEASEENTSTMYDLEQENLFLRNKLKELNVQLNKVIDHVKPSQFGGRQDTLKKKKPVDDKVEIANRQLDSANKTLAGVEEEHEKIQRQVGLMKDDRYMENLDNEIEKVQKQIEDQRKENKKIKFESLEHGKALHNLEVQNEGDIKGKDIDTKIKEIMLWKKKVKKLKEKMAELGEEENKKLEKLEKVSQDFEQIQEEAKELDIGTEDVNEIKRKQELMKLIQKEELEMKVRENAFKFNKAQMEKAFEELYRMNAREKEHTEKLEKMIKEQSGWMKKMSETTGLFRERTLSPELPDFKVRRTVGNSVEMFKVDTAAKQYSMTTKNAGKSFAPHRMYMMNEVLPALALPGKSESKLSKLLDPRARKAQNENEMRDRSAIVYGARNNMSNVSRERSANSSVVDFSVKKRTTGMDESLFEKSRVPKLEEETGNNRTPAKLNLFKKSYVKESNVKSQDGQDVGTTMKTTNQSEDLSDEKRILKTSSIISRAKNVKSREANLKLPERIDMKKRDSSNNTKLRNISPTNEILTLPETKPHTTKEATTKKLNERLQLANSRGVSPSPLNGTALSLTGVADGNEHFNKNQNLEIKTPKSNLIKEREGLGSRQHTGKSRLNRSRLDSGKVFNVKREESPAIMQKKEDVIHQQLTEEEEGRAEEFSHTSQILPETLNRTRDAINDERPDFDQQRESKKEAKRPRAQLKNNEEEELEDFLVSNKNKNKSISKKEKEEEDAWGFKLDSEKKVESEQPSEQEIQFGNKKDQRLKFGSQKTKEEKEISHSPHKEEARSQKEDSNNSQILPETGNRSKDVLNDDDLRSSKADFEQLKPKSKEFKRPRAHLKNDEEEEELENFFVSNKNQNQAIFQKKEKEEDSWRFKLESEKKIETEQGSEPEIQFGNKKDQRLKFGYQKPKEEREMSPQKKSNDNDFFEEIEL